ncbi:MAG: thioredoxin family protein [bacterium]
MAMTPSNMIPLGTAAPEFRLRDTDGTLVSLSDFAGSPALVVAFICNHCPFVKHIRDGLARFGDDMKAAGVAVVAISSNDIATHPADSPENMAKEKADAGYHFPYLFDSDQSVAAAYHAACTPDFFVFDKHQKLAYRGQFDDSRPSNSLAVTGNDVRAAVADLIAGRTPAADQKPSIGCNIKWSPGRQPAYAS